MTEVRVAGTPMEIELIARSLGTDAKMRRREFGGHEAPARPLDNQVL